MLDNIDRDQHYVGEFQLDGENLPGEILYNRERGVIWLSINRTVQGPGKSFRKLGRITGKLSSGSYVTLFQNYCIKNQTQNFHVQHLLFQSNYVIWSKNNNAAQAFNKMVCVVENGLEWGGMTQIDDDGFEGIKYKSLDTNKEYNWYGAKIKFSTHLENGLWHNPREEICKIVEHLQISIESEEKQAVDFFLQVRNKVMALISFAIKDNLNVVNQYLIDTDDYYILAKDIKQPYHHHITTNEPYHYLRNTPRFRYNFALKQLPTERDISDDLEKLEPVFNLYLSLFKYPDMPTEMVFLNIVQAVETFHSRFFYKNKKSAYIKSVTDRFGSYSNFDQIKKLLLCDTQMDENCGYIILLSRLNDLLIGKYDGLFCEFYLEDPKYAQRIADTRHYYTHYGKSKEEKAFKGDQLNEAITIMALLLEYNICLKLDIDIRNRIASELRSNFDYKRLDEINNKTSSETEQKIGGEI